MSRKATTNEQSTAAPARGPVAARPVATRPVGRVAGCTCLLFRKAARRVSQIYDHHLQPFGLTITQYGLLGHVNGNDGIGIGQLAALLVMDPTTLTRNLKPLQREGLIAFAQAPSDRRQRNLHLTDAGRTALSRARPGWDAAQSEIAGVLGEKDGPAVAGIIDRMLARLSD